MMLVKAGLLFHLFRLLPISIVLITVVIIVIALGITVIILVVISIAISIVIVIVIAITLIIAVIISVIAAAVVSIVIILIPVVPVFRLFPVDLPGLRCAEIVFIFNGKILGNTVRLPCRAVILPSHPHVSFSFAFKSIAHPGVLSRNWL